MMTLERIIAALRAARISEEEKEAWVRIIPHLSEAELEALIVSFEDETQDLASLRLAYLEKVQAVIDNVKAEEIKQRTQHPTVHP